MQSRLTLLANFLITSCRAGMYSRSPQPLATLSLPYLSCVQAQRGPCQEELMAPLPHAAMEHPGHAQVPLLPMGLVWRPATRADWTAETAGQNREERKFHKEEQYEFQRFDLGNILERCLYLFSTQHGFFLHRRDHRNFMILKIHRKIEGIASFRISNMVCFGCPLHQKERHVDIRYHTEFQVTRIQRVL